MIETQHISTPLLAAIIALLLPLLAFLIIGLFGRRLKRQGDWVAVSFTFIAFLFSAFCFSQIWQQAPQYFQLPWLNTGIIKLAIGLRLDNLSALMIILVTFITSLVMVYSMEYMKGETNYPRYFAHLSLFLFSMLGLVLADSLLLIYIFWELVGFSSYLLIGFWYNRDSAARASKKAFIVNRIGDIAFFIGILILLTQFGTLDLTTLFGSGNIQGLVQQSKVLGDHWMVINSAGSIHALNKTYLTIAGLCIFAGAAAKSAQFPLHTWLPDAMEGPTSVSSLIHAATMVAAGVYLVARVFPLFDSEALSIISVVGAFTAFMAASIAITQNDIKRVLAYSTISQLGFMITAIGLGAWSAALFHLVTHAFFKCLLFLGAGSVIHQLHHLKHEHHLDFDHQDLRIMGGLRKKMPVTYIVLLLAACALSGIVFFSGFLSKDMILMSAWMRTQTEGSGVTFLIALALSLAAVFTPFYIFRLIFKVFWGDFRLQKIHPAHNLIVHESNNFMKVPMMLLAAFTIFIFYSFNPIHAAHGWILEGLQAPLSNFNKETVISGFVESAVPAITLLLSIAAIFSAKKAYADQKLRFLSEDNLLFQFSQRAWYFDAIYDRIIVEPTVLLSKLTGWFDKRIVDGFVNLWGNLTISFAAFVAWIDKRIVDGFVNFTGSFSTWLGSLFRRTQTGRLQQYMALGVLGLILIFVLTYILH
ncbi:NADH-quinone oxidoreductase subunit L [Solitalea koreensis]|uniref:NADH-quinone oxidoreductase subunit L n=1 Tax=Solitalea koreensis TaxID=543615 RepID=A0A521D0U9_9SPHI|nr:NADH-quinone oxidoreductase subunit L [Solitalea koreensis]SMO65319.1 NADH-quinone oxidoreductase subunit L [Solitalea koreensis]